MGNRPWGQRKIALRSLFEEISSDYDRLNHVLSLGLDVRWRAWAGRLLEAGRLPGDRYVLDIASGTGDMAAVLRKKGARRVLRADLSPGLLRMGGRKLPGSVQGPSSAQGRSSDSPGLACEMDRLPLRDRSVAGITQAFALRHCREYGGFFAEMFRVVSPGGRVALLDMRYPARGPGSGLYRFYFRAVLPRLAALMGGEREAYEMMVRSVRSLPEEEVLVSLLSQAGFTEVSSRPGFLGAIRILTGRRPVQVDPES